jgi:hypothetical protein
MAKRIVIVWVVLVATGCKPIDWTRLEPEEPDVDAQKVTGTIVEATESLAFRDSVAQHTWVEGLRRMRVRGEALVVGLGDRGSTQCPRQLRQNILQELYKQPDFQRRKPGELTPEQLIDSRDTAVVSVVGEIPAAASAGTRFDVFVQAIPGTQTASLEGGRLWTCELRIFRDTGDGTTVAGKPLGLADGPLFQNPFAVRDDAATRTDARRGIVIGGGVALEQRRIRLVMTRPSYRRAMQIADRINTRFGGAVVAKAESPSYIQIDIPPEYRHEPRHFLAIVRHVYLPVRPGFAELRARELGKEILREDALHEDISLAWEAIGRPSLVTLRKLYAHSDRVVSYHAARAGIRLGDHSALAAMTHLARDSKFDLRLEAIRELGRAANQPGFQMPWRQLLEDPDPRVAVATYEALYPQGHRLVDSQRVGADNFVLDRIPCARDNLIYAKRSGERRIALIGNGIQCTTPVFYVDPGRAFLLNANEEDEELTVVRNAPDGVGSSPPMPVSRDTGRLLAFMGDQPRRDVSGDVLGLGVDYTALIQAMQSLCQDSGINARFMLEQTTTIDLFGPLTRRGRLESKL